MTPKYYSSNNHHKSTATLHSTSMNDRSFIVSKTDLFSKAMKESSGMMFKFKDFDIKITNLTTLKQENLAKLD
jgi:hypothetical protein